MEFSELLAAASQALSAPEVIVGRSARARAAASGVAPEQVLAEWAGVEAGAAASAPPAESPAPAAEPAAPATPAAPTPELDVEVVSPQATEEPSQPEPEPEPEPEEEPEEALIGAPGLRVTRRRSLPRWLAASFVVVPIVALFYAATFASGPGCGDGGALAVDAVTGVAENCDGSEFGSRGGNPLALGAALYSVEALPACSSCHGSDGGGGTGPGLAGGSVVETFPACVDHIQWVTLGTARWREEVGDTYGASNKPVGGGGIMQSYEAGLSPEEIAAVVLFERVTFGGQDAAEATADCLGEGETEAAG